MQQPKRNRRLLPPSLAYPTDVDISATYRSKNGIKIHIGKRDITRLFVGAVVNRASAEFQLAGGVAGAISKAAGSQLQTECTRYITKNGKLKKFQLYTSEAYNMPCHCIIHVNAPRWADYTDKLKAEACLNAVFINVLAEADCRNLPSIAIPTMGSGFYGGTLDIPAKIIFNAVYKFVSGQVAETQIRDIFLVDKNKELLEVVLVYFEQEVFQGTLQSIPAEFENFISHPEPQQRPKAEDTEQGIIHTVGASQFYRVSSIDNSKFEAASRPSASGYTTKEGYRHEIIDRPTDYTALNSLQHTSIESANHVTQFKILSRTDFLRIQTKDETCSICMEIPSNKVVLQICKHVFCKACIETWFRNKPTCPNCGQIHGEVKGDQPDGTMTTNGSPAHLPGYEECRGTIVIHYEFPGGRQKDCHPHPGHRFHGTRRTAYLPDSEEGNQVLRLLKRAFDARLIFTIGRSTTTGQDDQITWNDIHHKTSMSGGPARYGYPDAAYLGRVKEELAAKGIN